MSRLAPLLFASGLLGAGACGPGDAGGGIAELPALVPERTLHVGAIEDDEEAFTWFRVLEIGPRGRLFTIHPQENLIRIHGPEGEFLGTLGGIGEGPGEFSAPRALGFRRDTIWVLDAGTYRFSYFAPDGTFLGDERVPLDIGTGGGDDPPRPSGLLSDGTMWGSSPAWSHLVASGEITENAYVRLGEDAGILDTIAVTSLVNRELAVERQDGRGGFYTRQPYSDTEIVRISPYRPEVVRVDRTVRAEAEEPVFRVTKLSLEGDTLWSRTYPYEPVSLDATAVDSFVTGFAARVAERGFMARGEAEEIIRERLYRPSFLPPVSEALPGRDGSVWLLRSDGSSETRIWWVLSANGEPLGELELPRGFRALVAEEDGVWGMEMDELEVPYIVAYAVRPARMPEGSAEEG